MSHIIAVQAPLATVKKFLDTTEFSTVELLTPLAVVSQSTKVHLPDEHYTSEVENKDLCFIRCLSQGQLDRLSKVLNDYGFDLPPFEVNLIGDEEEDSLDEEQDIEAIIDSVEEENLILNRERAVDFLGRISNTSFFEQSDFDSLQGISPDEETHLENVSDAVSTVVDINSLSIVPSMLGKDDDFYAIFFIPDNKYIEDEEFQGMVTVSAVHQVDIFDHTTNPSTGGDIQVLKNSNGRYLAVDNAFILSAIEGIIPGHVVVSSTKIGKDDSGNEVFTPQLSGWKLSHNWVEGLSQDNFKEQLEDFLDTVVFTSDNENDKEPEIVDSKDINIPEYPFLKPCDYNKGAAVSIVRSLGASVS